MVNAHFAVLLLVLAELNWVLFRVLIGSSTSIMVSLHIFLTFRMRNLNPVYTWPQVSPMINVIVG